MVVVVEEREEGVALTGVREGDRREWEEDVVERD